MLTVIPVVLPSVPPFLQVVFLALIMLKGFSYSLNNPCKEILYQPTNSAVKFKSKVRRSVVHFPVKDPYRNAVVIIR